jgi:hypothetical protein
VKVYLASRYSRRQELSGYRDELTALGIQVTSRWIDGPGQRRLDNDQLLGPEEEFLVESGATTPEALEVRRLCAAADLWDVGDAQIMLTFTFGGGGRGGRHVEWGYALAQGLTLVVVGPREHIFHDLAHEQFDSWQEAKGYLLSLAEGVTA